MRRTTIKCQQQPRSRGQEEGEVKSFKPYFLRGVCGISRLPFQQLPVVSRIRCTKSRYLFEIAHATCSDSLPFWLSSASVKLPIVRATVSTRGYSRQLNSFSIHTNEATAFRKTWLPKS